MSTPAPAAKPSRVDLKAKVGTVAIATLLLWLAATISPNEGGRRLDVYVDSAGIPTVCTGIIGPQVTAAWQAAQATPDPAVRKQYLHFTNERCDALETKYLARMHADLSRCLTPQLLNDLSVGEYLGYGDGDYNFGTGAMCNSPMAAKAAAGDRRGACEAIASFRVHTGTRGNRKPPGKGVLRNGRWLQDCRDPANKCTGLPARRLRERELCLAGLES